MFLSEKKDTAVRLLSRALHRIRATPPRIIASPATRESMQNCCLGTIVTQLQNLVVPL
jgi:hypothetical protein